MKSSMKKIVKGQVFAYMAVEAACIVPIMLGVVIFVIYLMFFAYNRCLLEQDVALCSMTQGEMPGGRETDRYLAWQMNELCVSRSVGTIRANGSGYIEVPFIFGNSRLDSLWKIEAEASRLDVLPADWLRLCRVLQQKVKR